jgi:hypothetical protein
MTLTTRKSKTTCAAVALLLVMMALLAGGAARHESVAVDEVAHIGAGVSYLQKLDLRMNEEHPPLAKVFAALPLVLRGVHADYSHTSWTFSGKMFNEFLGEWVFGHWLIMRWNDPFSTVMWARVPMLLITLLLGFVIYVCGSRLGGVWGGLLSLCAYTTMPAFLAFGPLVVTDIAVALFWLLAVWQMPELWHTPSRGKVMQFGAVLAGAFLTKFSSGLLFFVFIALALSLRWRTVPEQPSDKQARKKWRRRAWANLGKATAWSSLFVYVLYFVLSWNEPTATYDIIPHFPGSPVLRRALMPVWKYIRGLLGFALSAGSRPTYILGHGYPHGVWFYFPALFVLKSPLAFLLLLVLALVIAIVLKRRLGEQVSAIPAGLELRWRALWVSLLVFVAACMLNRLDISIRHFLIALVLLILLIAPLPTMLDSLQRSNWLGARALRWAALGLATVSIATAALAYPHYLSFLNSLSLGRPGFLLVNDSNLDWNQALPEAEKFVRDRGLKHILLDEYAFSEPTAYMPGAEIWSCQEATSKDGGQLVLVSASNIADGHNCLWMMQYPHQALAGGGMYAIQLPAEIPPAGMPGGPPTADAYRYFGGTPYLDPRPIFMKCIRDPEQLQPTMDWMVAFMKATQKKK